MVKVAKYRGSVLLCLVFTCSDDNLAQAHGLHKYLGVPNFSSKLTSPTRTNIVPYPIQQHASNTVSILNWVLVMLSNVLTPARRSRWAPKPNLTGFDPKAFIAATGTPANDPWKKAYVHK